LPKPGVELFGSAVVRGLGDAGPQDDAPHAGGARHVDGLDILVIGADIADVREGEGDDLAGIGRIGEDLLVAGHGGVEADLAGGDAGGADADALEARPVPQDQYGGGRGVLPACHGSTPWVEVRAAARAETAPKERRR